MTYQSQANGYVGFKAQTAKGSIASGGSGFLLRLAGGPGGKLTKQSYGSKEIRRDLMRSRGRHGGRRTSGSYTVEVSLDNMDSIYQAVFRGTYESALVVTEATAGLTSITTTTSTIVASAGSWITAGFRVGDVVRLTGHATTANNSKNLRITGLTALVMTVAETLVLDAVADTAFTVTRPGQKLINPAAGASVKTYFTVEEYDGDLDLTEIFSDVIFTSLKFTMAPNSILMCDIGWTGTGAMTTAATGSAPTFTSPTESTGVPLACVDATVRYNATDFVDLTSWDATIDIGANAPDVVGSVYAPDVFTGSMAVSMNFSMLRSDYGKMTDFLAETPMTFHMLAVENDSEPKDFFSLFVPNYTIGGVDKSPLSKEPGPPTQTTSTPADLVGIDTQGGAFDSCMVKLAVSNT